MPVNMKALRKYARVKPKAAPAPAPAPAPKIEAAPAPEVEAAPAPEVEAAPAPEWSMENSKAELVAAAEAAGVEFKSTWKKADILAALTS